MREYRPCTTGEGGECGRKGCRGNGRNEEMGGTKHSTEELTTAARDEVDPADRSEMTEKKKGKES